MKLTVGIAQLPVTRDIKANLAAVLGAIDQAADAKAQILLTPEGSLSGYTPAFDEQALEHALTQVRQRAALGASAWRWVHAIARMGLPSTN